MNEYYTHLIHLFSIPIYGIIIPLEIVLSHMHGWKFYSWKQTLLNIYLNLLNVGFDLLLRGLALIVLVFFSGYAVTNTLNPLLYWLLLFVCEDIVFWAEHFVDHHVRVFWAVHVTHHSSEEFNLSTGFRSSVFMPFYRYLYFIPLALLGFHPADIFFMYALTQTYGILVHTQSIGKLPRWVEAILVTPSHHRVHHGMDAEYLDKNYGGIFILWDRLFGTFQAELFRPHYGLTKPVNTFNIWKLQTHEYVAIGRDVRAARRWLVKLGYAFGPPGWAPRQAAQPVAGAAR
jgi:sterol desaturase/sphingolipid hydroxylase (fatty acid hydroxylase superfamily)